MSIVLYRGIEYMWKDAQGYWRLNRTTKLHRYVWELYNGPIPDGYDVHHGDGKGNFDGEGNKNCNCICNLRLMKHEEHLRLHALNRSKETQEKISKSLVGREVKESTKEILRLKNTGWKPTEEMVNKLIHSKRIEGIKKSNKTGYKGVWWDEERGRYQAYIRNNGKRKFLGRFNDPESAARAYDSAARKYFGDDCFINFPQDNLDSTIVLNHNEVLGTS
jgi:hypothetical protein